MMKKTEHIFCPKCGCMSLENDHNEGLEWIADDDIGSTEAYVCARCGHEFEVATTYALSGFYFLNGDEDNIDYEIVDEE